MSTHTITDPWSGEVLGEAPLIALADVESVCRDAVTAFEKMRALSSFERSQFLRNIAAGIEQQKSKIAKLIAQEAGKPITLAESEVSRAVITFTLGAEEAARMGGEVIPVDVTSLARGYRAHWVRVPIGPVLAISPFNFPLNLAAHKVAPALAVGTSVVLKPPPQAPLTSLLLLDIVRAAGGPENAVQVASCEVDVAEAFVRDERFAVLSFTGSAKVGWYLKNIAGRKKVVLELGGNSAVIVHDDAPLEYAAERICFGAFAYAGQVCAKVQRLYVQDSVADELLNHLVNHAKKITPRSTRDREALLGPMIDEASAQRVALWVNEAREAGAKLHVGGTQDRNRFAATILEIEGDGRGLKVVDEEIFGPVLTVHRYREWSDALRMAGATKYGLQAGIFTDSKKRIDAAFQALDVGGVIVGDISWFRVDSMPFGGMRESGFGREGVRYAMEDMTERKLLVSAPSR